MPEAMRLRPALSSLVAAAAVAAPAALATAHASEPAWLDEVNRYRAASRLAPVVDEPSWTAGIAAHLRYLAKTPTSLRTGAYASAHTENPASPYYSQAGATEAASSDLAGGIEGDVGAIDGWLTAPFHAIGMLRPNLTRIAFALDPASGYAGLDVINGLTWGQPRSAPVLFPGPGMTTNLTSFSGESPDPLESCRWTSAGLPLVALLTSPPDPGIAATLTGPGGSLKTCVVTANNFVTTDTVYGPTGRSLLSGDRAVFVIPKEPLAGGAYSVRITQPGQADISWSFNVTAPKQPAKQPALPAARSTERLISIGHLHASGTVATVRMTVRPPLLGRRARVTVVASFRGGCGTPCGGWPHSRNRTTTMVLHPTQVLRLPYQSGSGWEAVVHVRAAAFQAGGQRYAATDFEAGFGR